MSTPVRLAAVSLCAILLVAGCGGNGDADDNGVTQDPTDVAAPVDTEDPADLEEPVDIESLAPAGGGGGGLDVISVTSGNGWRVVAGALDDGTWCAHIAGDGPAFEVWDESACVVSTGDVDAQGYAYELADSPAIDGEQVLWGLVGPDVDSIVLEGSQGSTTSELSAGVIPRDEIEGRGAFSFYLRPDGPSPNRLVFLDATGAEVASVDF